MRDREEPIRRWWRARAAITAIAVVAATLATGAAPAAAMAPAEAWTETLDHDDMYFGGDAGPDGSVVVGGRASTATGGGGIPETAGFVRQINAAGAEEWRFEVDTAGAYEQVFDVAVNANGSGVAIGETRGDVAGTNAGDVDVWVRGFTSGGGSAWTDQFGTADTDVARAIAVGTDGSAYASGVTAGVLAAGGGGNLDGFVRKYTSTGAVSWTVQFGGADDDLVQDIAVANDGTIWVVGYTAPVSSGERHAFITRISSSGGVLSTDTVTADFPGTVISDAHGVSAHPDGGVVVGGELITATDFTGFLRRYAADGTETWSHEIVEPDAGSVNDIDIGADGTILVVGFPFSGNFEEGYVAAFSSAGALEWARDIFSSNLTFVVAPTDGGVFTHSSGILSQPGELLRLAGSGGGGGTFTDVSADAFYAAAVEWLKAEGITTGTSPTTYSPDATVTRGQMAAFLHRLVGEPGGSPDPGFSDVPSGAFYEAAVAWLKAEGITTGTSPTTYSPDAPVTRGQMAAFLWRLAGEPGGSPAHGFSDVPATAFYADAVAWLKAQGITTGTSATTYSPDDVVTRGQMAAFLFRMATDSDWVRPTT